MSRANGKALHKLDLIARLPIDVRPLRASPQFARPPNRLRPRKRTLELLLVIAFATRAELRYRGLYRMVSPKADVD